MWISLRGLAGEGGGSGGVGNCVSMKVQVSQSWNKQITFIIFPLPFTLSDVTTTFLERVGSSHCLHILVPFCSPASAFASHHSLETALSKVTSELQERNLGGAFFSGSSSLMWFSPPHSTHLPHPVLPWPLLGCFFNLFLLLNDVFNFRLQILS